MVRSIFPPPPAPNPPALPAVKAAQAYASDIVSATQRLQDSWSLACADDALRSIEFFVKTARTAFELELNKTVTKNEH